MILPIFNVLDDLDPNLINASYDLGANRWDTFRHVVFPVHEWSPLRCAVCLYKPELFMLTRMIVFIITLGSD